MRTLTLNENVVKSLLCIARDRTVYRSNIGLLFRNNDTIVVGLNDNCGIFFQLCEVVPELKGKSIKLPIKTLEQFSKAPYVSVLFDFDNNVNEFALETHNFIDTNKIETSEIDYSTFLEFCKFDSGKVQSCNNRFSFNPKQFLTLSEICKKNNVVPTIIYAGENKPMVVLFDSPYVIGIVMPVFNQKQWPDWV